MKHLALATTLLALASPREAWANGRYPAAQHVLVGPGSSSDSIVLRSTFGFLVSRDGGESFGWMCEGALGYGGEFDPPFALDGGGRIHIGLYDGLVRASADGCGVERLAAFEGQNVVDLDNHPSGASVFALVVTPFVSNGPPVEARVFRSDDGGGAYELVSSAEGLLLETLEHAPSLPSRVYFGGATAPPSKPIVLRSDDGGATLSELPFAWPSDVERLFVAGIHPLDEDVFFLRGSLSPSSGKSTAIFRTDDGGATFEEVLRTEGPALGFAVSADGDAWVGSPADGLWSSVGGAPFEQIGDAAVRCLRHHEGALYVCAGPPEATPLLGRSTDGGLAIEGLASTCELVGTPTCTDPGNELTACEVTWPQVASVLPCIEEPGSGGGGGGGATATGGAATSTADSSSNAGGGAGDGGAGSTAADGCSAAPQGHAGSRSLLLAALALGAALSARRGWSSPR